MVVYHHPRRCQTRYGFITPKQAIGLRARTISKRENPKNRLEPTTLAPISVDDALRGALQTPPPDDKPKKKRKAKKKGKRKKKAAL